MRAPAFPLAPGSALYRITAEIVAADRDAALSILLKLVNDGYTSLRERGDLPISWSQGDVSGNGEFRAGLYSESITELDRQLALASEYMGDCAKLERKADLMAKHAREAFFRAEARRKAAQLLPNINVQP